MVNTVLSNLDLLSLYQYPFYKSRRIHGVENIVQEVCKHISGIFSKAADINIIVPEPVTRNIIEDSVSFREMLTNLQKEFEIAVILYIIEYILLPVIVLFEKAYCQITCQQIFTELWNINNIKSIK